MLHEIVREFKKDKYFKWGYAVQYYYYLIVSVVFVCFNALFILGIVCFPVALLCLLLFGSVSKVDIITTLSICVILGGITKALKTIMIKLYFGIMQYDTVTIVRNIGLCDQINKLYQEDILTTNKSLNIKHKQQLNYLCKVFGVLDLSFNKPLFIEPVDRVLFHELRVKSYEAHANIRDLLKLLQRI